MSRLVVGLAVSQPSLEDTMRRYEFVYYVRHRGHVKIGTSTNLLGRLRTLRARPTDLLAYEFGGRDIERQRHEQFAHLRVEGPGLGIEHFADGPDLIAHMDQLMAEAKARAVADSERPWEHATMER